MSYDFSEYGKSIRLIGALFSDDKNGHINALILPNETGVGLKSVNWQNGMTVEDWQALQRQTDSVPTEALVKEGNKPAGKAIIMKAQRQVSQIVSWNVYRRDDFRCRYCAFEGPLTVDHLITWESGGPSIEENLLTACRNCNGIRGETPYAEWLNSSDYKKRSRKLSHAQQFANQALIPTLNFIPVSPHVIKGKKRKGRR